MKAVLLHEHGGPDVLVYCDHEIPQPGPGEVLIELKAASLNRLDIWVRDGWPQIKLEYPHILGADGAGVVAALGNRVTGAQIGDRVAINPDLWCGGCSNCYAGRDNLCDSWGLLGESVRGTYAQYLVVPERNLLPLPDDVRFEIAAAASLVYLTAWHSLITRGRLRAGESVVVVGSGGGVNSACIQIARLAGAKVYVVGAGVNKLEKAEALGAHVLIDRLKEDWSHTVFKLTEQSGADVVVDNVGAETFYHSIRSARKGGRILTVGNTSGPKFELDNRYLFGKHLTIIGSSMGTHSDFMTVMALVFDGKLTPVIDSTFPLSEAQAAHRKMESGDLFGKIVLLP